MEVILKITANDRPGVLDRIAGLIRRHGWNVNTLTAGNLDEGITQINLSLKGHDVNMDILGERLSELHGIQGWERCVPESALIREAVLCRLPDDVHSVATWEGVRILETGTPAYGEFTGTPQAVFQFIALAREYGVRCVRSGVLILDKEIRENGE